MSNWIRRIFCSHPGHSVEWRREGDVVYYKAKCPECDKDIPLPQSIELAAFLGGKSGTIVREADDE